MATQEQDENQNQQEKQELCTPSSSESYEKILSQYLGISFTIFLGSLPKNATSLVTNLQTHNKDLTFKLIQAEEELKELYSRRKEDSKANARVVEIFASHRHGWQQEEKRLLLQIDECGEEIAHLRGKVEDLEKLEAELRRDISERDEMLNFMSRRSCGGDGGVDGDGDNGGDGGEECEEGSECYADLGLRYGKSTCSEGVDMGIDECFLGNGVHSVEEMSNVYSESNGYSPDFLNSSSKFWSQTPSPWQDVQYESLESQYNLKQFVARRESPWKVDGESTGVSSKLKLLEQELLNLERVGKTDLSKLPSIMRKQAKRYQALVGKIEDLCRRMQTNDPCEPTISTEFRTQRQTEFLLEAFRLQQRASETAQKLMALQSEAGKSCFKNELEGHAILATRRSFDSIRNNFREIQRNLEIWLARIIGDLEGILSRDGASRVREYYISRYPYVQQ